MVRKVTIFIAYFQSKTLASSYLPALFCASLSIAEFKMGVVAI
jgi:hypothetical protein